MKSSDDFYQLKEMPFNITGDPAVFYESQSHREALAALLYGIQQKKGLILITGEVGTGKTTLCKALLDRLPGQVKTSLILNPYFSEVQLLQAIVEDFGLQISKKNRLGIVKELNNFLVQVSLSGGNAVVIIDEAQNLKESQLEQVRLLSNLETSREKLLQIVLSGQPELLEKLSRHNMRQVRQRIFVKHNILPLQETEVREYVRFRLSKAGTGGIKISPASFDMIYSFSGGIPRLVNMLCERALLLGYVKETKTLDENIFKTCIEELTWGQ